MVKLLQSSKKQYRTIKEASGTPDRFREIVVRDTGEDESWYNEAYLDSDLPYDYVRLLARSEFLLDAQSQAIIGALWQLSISRFSLLTHFSWPFV